MCEQHHHSSDRCGCCASLDRRDFMSTVGLSALAAQTGLLGLTTSLLADTPAALDEGLHFLEKDAHRRRIGHAARVWVKSEIGDWSDCAARYVAAYRQVLGRSRP